MSPDLITEENIDEYIESLKNSNNGKYIVRQVIFKKDDPIQMRMLKETLLEKRIFGTLMKNILKERYKDAVKQEKALDDINQGIATEYELIKQNIKELKQKILGSKSNVMIRMQIMPIELLHFEKNQVTIWARTESAKKWLETQHQQTFEMSFSQLLGKSIAVAFTTERNITI